MKDNFAPSLAHVGISEAGYVNNPHDNGGPTNGGITQHEYDDWRKRHGQPPRDVRLLDPNEKEAIYRGDYWDAVRGDDLPSGVDYCVFDCAVNSGPVRAIKLLQQALGVTADGKLGPQTLAAVNAADPRRVITTFSAEREAYVDSLPTARFFAHGWDNRIATVEATARGMA